MPAIDVDDRTYAQVRFAARAAGVSEAVVVSRAVEAYVRGDEGPPVRDAWEPVPIYSEYAGQRVDGLFLPATQRVTVTSGAVSGKHFRSPSGAARAVVRTVKPDRNAPQTNGWRFWHLDATGDYLEVLRTKRT